MRNFPVKNVQRYTRESYRAVVETTNVVISNVKLTKHALSDLAEAPNSRRFGNLKKSTGTRYSESR